jgi:hypothetical protein
MKKILNLFIINNYIFQYYEQYETYSNEAGTNNDDL